MTFQVDKIFQWSQITELHNNKFNFTLIIIECSIAFHYIITFTGNEKLIFFF
jgi:hypothetical protein